MSVIILPVSTSLDLDSVPDPDDAEILALETEANDDPFIDPETQYDDWEEYKAMLDPWDRELIPYDDEEYDWYSNQDL